MAAESGLAQRSLIEELAASARGYSFFQAVHRIQQSFPDAARVGTQGPPERECLRFHADVSLAFPSSDVVEIRSAERAGDQVPRFELTTSFIGLYGSVSPLPTYYTEELYDQDLDESLVREFMDLFHHRAVSLLYRAWEKYRYAMQFRAGGTDELSRRLMRLAGLDPATLPGRVAIPTVRLLAYAGLLAQIPHSASALRGALADYFEDVDVAVEPCARRYLEIPEAQQNRLARLNSQLGVDLSIGERVLDRSSTYRVRLGPVDRQTFASFLPPGERTSCLRTLVDLFDVDGLDAEVEVWIRAEEIPELRLSSDSALLGWSTWLGRRPSSDQFVRYLMKGKINDQR